MQPQLFFGFTHDELDIIIKLAAFVGGLISVIFAFQSTKDSRRKVKYEFFKYLYNDFLSSKFLNKRNEVAGFWIEHKVTHNNGTVGGVNIQDLAHTADDNIAEFVNKRLGAQIAIADDVFVNMHCGIIADTEYILNKYEHLAKLIETGAIDIDEAKTFFYTMFADTFVACLPYILYRRQYKTMYASKMQKLLEELPCISKNWARV